MELSKQHQAEARQVYELFWESYLKGDEKTFASTLDDAFEMIGTSETEIAHGKAQGLIFYKSQVRELDGKAELRNRQITFMPVDGLILINELADIYALVASDWIFYSKLRLSTFLRLTVSGWKVVQQHGSLPDARVKEGETVAFEKISKENLELRDAVKRRTAELENKTRELEIEASLERVRTVAMSMRNPDDMLEVCRIISQQSESLGIKEIRNVQTAIIYEDKGTYLNYEYYAKHDKLLVTEVDYKNHELQSLFANRMLQGAEQLFAEALSGKEVKDWYRYQKTTNQFADTYLENAQSLNYYFYSLGPVALGISTYSPLSEEEINLFKRFRNVFDLAYRRFLDIEKAEAQAREAQIELGLERVRARAMAMQKSEELAELVDTVFKELTKLHFLLDRCIIMLYDPKTHGSTWWMADPEPGSVPVGLFIKYHEHKPYLEYIKAWQARTLKWEYLLEGTSKKEWDEYIFSETDLSLLPEFVIDGMRSVERVFLNASFNNFGSLTVSTVDPLPEAQFEIVLRFAKVFDMTYTRFHDLKQAEAQAREAQIEAAVERVRAKSMGMYQTSDLYKVNEEVLSQLYKLRVDGLTGVSIYLVDENDIVTVWDLSSPGNMSIPNSYSLKYDAKKYPVIGEWVEIWKSSDQDYFVLDFPKETLLNAVEEFKEIHPEMANNFKNAIESGNLKHQWNPVGRLSDGLLSIDLMTPPTEDTKVIVIKMAGAFNMAYQRFMDLQKAEAQAREALIEAALERIRSRALSMHKSLEVGDVSDLLFSELEKMDINPTDFSIMVFDWEQDKYDLWRAKEVAHQGVYETFSIKAMYDKLDQYIPGFTEELELKWNSGAPFFIAELSGQKRIAFLEANREMGNYTKEQFENVQKIYPDPVFWQLIFFKHGWLGLIHSKQLAADDLLVIRRFADVFEFAHTRFLDLQKAEAHALQAQEDLTAIKAARQRAEEALAELQVTQKQLIQSEKMASLGELTAGIAHEIQNPLNFVNNFSEVNSELIEELEQEVEKGNMIEVKALAKDIKENEQKINHHGKRADAIVKGMLQHSRSSNGVKESTDINALADEYLRLAYHGLRAKDKSFNATLKTDFDETIGKIDIIPQDIGRVILNLITNAFYAVDEKKKQNPEGYEPTVSVSTIRSHIPPPGGPRGVLISVADNGPGIPQKVMDKIFQPFFTTKPTGQGTGLGLSLAYDIVKAHGGELKVETKEGEGSEFIIRLPY